MDKLIYWVIRSSARVLERLSAVYTQHAAATNLVALEYAQGLSQDRAEQVLAEAAAYSRRYRVKGRRCAAVAAHLKSINLE